MNQQDLVTPFKLFMGSFTTLSAYILNSMDSLIWILIICCGIDHASAWIAAGSHGRLDSRQNLQGILKKLGYFIVVLIAILIQYILSLSNVYSGHYVYNLVIMWLIGTEMVSTLANLQVARVPVPQFLQKIIKTFMLAEVERKFEKLGLPNKREGG